MTTGVAGRVLVCRVEADAHTVSRLRTLGERSGAFTVADVTTPDVHVFAVTDEDGSRLGDLRRLTRLVPDVRTVVIGDGTERFGAAFEAGADAWIDRGADDETVVVAVTGRHPVASARRSRSRSRWRSRRRFPLTTLALGRT